MASFGLVVDAHGLVDGKAGVDGVLADEVPVAHPGGAVVAYGSVVGEGSCGGSCLATPSERVSACGWRGAGFRRGRLRGRRGRSGRVG